MERMRDEYEQRITNIEAEARERIQVAVREAHVARDDLLAQARAQAEQMLERARLEVGHEKEKAMQEIRDLVADLATGAAARILNKELDAQSHRQLIDDVIDSVAKNGGSR
jgi:F-type H+-transporting ATPase subunit b